MKVSSGILLFRRKETGKEYLLLRPGGPFYKNKELGIWTIPKGLVQPQEAELAAAKREFEEETGQALQGEPTFLTRLKWNASKKLVIYSLEGDLDTSTLVSNTFELEYPKHSGKYQHFPEIEKGAWLSLEEAKPRIHPKLLPVLKGAEDNF